MNNPIKNDELEENTTPKEAVVVTETSEGSHEPTDTTMSPIPPAKKDAAQQIKDMGKKVPLGPGNFWNNMLTTVLLLIVVTAVFSYLTEKNTKVIRAILMTDVWSRVLALPQSLMAEAQRMLNRSPQKAATLAAVALQIQILTRAPVRVGNLLSIRIGHNLTRAGSNESSYRLCFPNYDVKNRVDLDFPLGKKTTEIIDQFIDVFRPHLGDGHRGDWLFPGDNGKPRSSAHASVSIAKRLEREIGLRVTAHQFRHGAAAMVLKAQPGNYEFARRILGHRNIATTIRFYTALESFKAAEVFGAMMEEQMGNPGSGNAKHRIRRKGLAQPTSTLSGRGSEHGNK